MKYILIIASLLIAEIIIGLLRLIRKTNGKTVCLPKFFFTSGTVASIIFIIIVAITLYNGEESWIPILFSVFSIISLMLTVAYLNCRITYDESEIICRNLLGFTKKYSYDDIIGIENWDSEDLIFFGKEQKVISVDYCLLGGIEFVVFINKKYSLLHMGKDIPHIRNTIIISKYMLTIITSTKIYSNFINQVFINAKHIYGIKITIKSRNIFFKTGKRIG